MMYSYLEEDRKTPLQAAEKSDGADCPCQCKATKEQAAEEAPAGNQTAIDLNLHWDYNK
jgi:hypothetical protein